MGSDRNVQPCCHRQEGLNRANDKTKYLVYHIPLPFKRKQYYFTLPMNRKINKSSNDSHAE